MAFGTLETLATIVIAFAVIKLLIILASPKSWLVFAKKIWSKPKITSFVAFVLAAVVLYYLVNAGVTVVDIFAIMTFVSLLLAAGMAPYANELIRKVEKNPGNMLKENWFYVLVWVALLFWGIIVIFF